MDYNHTLDLRKFGANDHPLSDATGRMLAECASVCLAHNSHDLEVHLEVSGLRNEPVRIVRNHVTDVIRRSHGDLQHAQEHGAYAVGIGLLMLYEGFTAVEQSAKSTGIDYYLGDDDGLMFQRKARLEVSSLLTGTDTEVKQRTREKLKQTERSTGSFLPAYVAIVEFGRPATYLVKQK